MIHLDSASASIVSDATFEAVLAHLRREREIGPTPAAHEAAEAIDGLRQGLGALLGLRGDQVALVESATRGMATVLDAFPARRIAVLRSEYGSTRMTLDAAARRGEIELIEVEEVADAVDCDLVVASPVPSQRGVVQSVATDLPLVLDVAQAAGHVDVSAMPAAAWVGTSRKWLRGPRGAAFVAVADEWAERLQPRSPDLDSADWDGPAPGAARFEKYEVSYAARVGWANAVAELHAAGPAVVTDRIVTLGRTARARLAEHVDVLEPLDSSTGTVTFTVPGRDPAEVHRMLFDDGIVVSLIPQARAPRDMAGPVLRASFHTYNDEGDIDALLGALGHTKDV